MLTFRVNDMTCGHCVASVTNAVKAVDPAAQVDVDLAQHLVKIDTQAAAPGIAQAIRDAGFTPQPA
ncbi:MAG: copZ [Paucimonas sp.]|nr:copZ [Paucimonas sp.]